MANHVIPLLQLMQTKGVGPRSIARVLDRLQEERLSLRDFVALDAAEIVERFGLREEQAESIQANEEVAAKIAEHLDEHQIRLLVRGGDSYPSHMTSVLGEKAPPYLFVAGARELLDRPGVGFCGARDASEEALRCTEEMARALAKQGQVIISGHAQGVDETAHRAALEAGGKTALVLPEGMLQFRPRPTLGDLLSEGQFVVVSEFPPKLPWSVQNAMQRNRTICGLARALVVIEAGASGGTWEAGLAALDLGVPLFVLDFPEPTPSGSGNPLLLKKGGQALPCQPGESPDLTSLIQALEMKPPSRAKQLSLF